MDRRNWIFAAVTVVIFALGAAWGHYGFLAQAEAQEGTKVIPLEDQPAAVTVVAATPHQFTAENEEDPFNPDRIRRTRTTVTSVVLVYADGTTKVRPVAR